MTPDDDKPLTPAQARQKLQKGLEDYLAGHDNGPIFFRLKRTKKATRTKISQVVPKSGEQLSFSYEYDFGDGWKHEVLFEGDELTPPTCQENPTGGQNG